jgi:hypothetical protein
MDVVGRQRTAILGCPAVDHTTSGSQVKRLFWVAVPSGLGPGPLSVPRGEELDDDVLRRLAGLPLLRHTEPGALMSTGGCR